MRRYGKEALFLGLVMGILLAGNCFAQEFFLEINLDREPHPTVPSQTRWAVGTWIALDNATQVVYETDPQGDLVVYPEIGDDVPFDDDTTLDFFLPKYDGTGWVHATLDGVAVGIIVSDNEKKIGPVRLYEYGIRFKERRESGTDTLVSGALSCAVLLAGSGKPINSDG